MSSSTTFIGSGFTLQSVTPIIPGVVRVRFTSDPLQLNPAAANDGLNISNYSVTGPGIAVVSSVSTVPGDTQSLDVHLTAPLSTGIWTLTASSIQTPALDTIGSPSSLPFAISETGDATPLTAGAENDDTPDRVIRKHLSDAIRGPNTDALIEALSRGDDINWNNSQLGFDQLFRSTASGRYLDRLGANEGLQRPTSLGLSDELFRKLLIRYATSKITHNALRGILEVFYGQDALRAWAETESEEPYSLADGMTLTWTLDGTQEFSATFSQNQFLSISSARAEEIAAILTKTMAESSDGFGFVAKDAVTGGNRVRIYSGALGLKSFVRITGGTAQPYLRFNSPRDTYSGTVSPGHGYIWQYSNPTPVSTRVTLTTTGAPLVDVSSVEAGDYVVINEEVGVVPGGTYTISEVGQYWDGADYVQYFEIGQNLGYTGGALQLSNYSYQFFNPKRVSTQSGDRTVVVSQTENGAVDIQLPATTQAVNRNNTSGAYLHGNPTNPILRYWRDETGLLTIQTSIEHGLSEGQYVQLDGFQPRGAHPFISPAVAGASDGGFVSGYRGIPGSSTPNTDFAAGALLQDGQVLWTGGAINTAGTYGASVTTGNLLNITGTEVVTDGSEATGALRRTYEWAPAAAMPTARSGHSATTLQDGRVLVKGGFGVGAGAFALGTSHVYSPTLDSWTSTTGPQYTRFGHGQILLDDGRVFAFGGAIGKGVGTDGSELYDPSSNSWAAGPNMSVPRYKPAYFKLPDGRVMVCGGYTLGRTNSPYPENAVQWKLDDQVLPTLLDVGTASPSAPLTASNSPSFVVGKVSYARRFSGTSYATGASSAGMKAALLNGWIVDFWITEPFSAPASDAVIVAHKGAGETSADNALFEVGIAPTGRVYWTFESGAGVDHRSEVPTASLTDGRHHVLIMAQKTGISTVVTTYIDNVLVQSNLFTFFVPFDGSAGSFWLCGDPSGVTPDVNGFRGAVDEVHVAPYTANNALQVTVDANRNYRHVRSAGWASDLASWNEFGGDILNSTEIYDPVTNTWSAGPAMRYCHAGATAIDIGGGRYAVHPGTSRDPSGVVPNVTVWGWQKHYPNQPGRHVEIYDSNIGRWIEGPSTSSRYWEPVVSDVVSGLQHSVASSGLLNVYRSDINYSSASIPTALQADAVELWNVRSGVFSFAAHANTVFHNQGVKISDGLIAFAGGTAADSSDTNPHYGIWSRHSDFTSGNGLNGLHKIVATDAVAKTFSVDTKIGNYSSNFGSTSFGGIANNTDGTYSTYYDWIVATSAERTVNTTTITVSDTVGISVGDDVFLNSNSLAFPSGIKRVIAIGPTEFSYTDLGGVTAPTAINGTVAKNFNPTATYELQTIPADETKGPNIFDVQAGLAVTSVDTTTSVAIGKGTQLNQLFVTSTEGFPDGTGYLVFDLGGARQSGPIKYLEVVGTNSLLMDFGAVVPQDYPAGTMVTLLSKLGPYEIQSEDNQWLLYATGSNVGRISAEQLVRAVAAAGMSINVNVVYPGDRGLGSEGAPTEGASRLSDSIWVWGSDNFGGNS